MGPSVDLFSASARPRRRSSCGLCWGKSVAGPRSAAHTVGGQQCAEAGLGGQTVREPEARL